MVNEKMKIIFSLILIISFCNLSAQVDSTDYFCVKQITDSTKDDISTILYRFQRSYIINKVSTPVRFTLYKAGAWRRELKDSKGIWKNYPYVY
jgi:hypothetical protein